MELYVDDDGYVCFMEGEVYWTLHYGGWEAFLPNKYNPCLSTGEITFPTDDELAEAQKILEIVMGDADAAENQ